MPVDPRLQPLLDAVGAAGDEPVEIDAADIAAARAFANEMANEMIETTFAGPAEPALAGVAVDDHLVDVDGGKITVRTYTPSGGGPHPGHLNLHGGGFWMGTLVMEDGACAALAASAECVVASADYRLAPEHPYPIPPEDGYAALVWLDQNAERLGIDRTRLSVGGASSGGALAAAVALMARDRDGPVLATQVLEVPCLDPALDTPAAIDNAKGFLLSTATMRQFWDRYIGPDGDPDEGYLAPLRADDLSGLPPALIITAEYDPLRDDGERYGDRLRQAGVTTTVSRYDGMLHGFSAMTKLVPAAGQARAEVAAWLRQADSRVN